MWPFKKKNTIMREPPFIFTTAVVGYKCPDCKKTGYVDIKRIIEIAEEYKSSIVVGDEK